MKETHACVQTSVVTQSHNHTHTHTKQGRMSSYTQRYIFFSFICEFFNSLRLMKMAFGKDNHAKDMTLIKSE